MGEPRNDGARVSRMVVALSAGLGLLIGRARAQPPPAQRALTVAVGETAEWDVGHATSLHCDASVVQADLFGPSLDRGVLRITGLQPGGTLCSFRTGDARLLSFAVYVLPGPSTPASLVVLQVGESVDRPVPSFLRFVCEEMSLVQTDLLGMDPATNLFRIRGLRPGATVCAGTGRGGRSRPPVTVLFEILVVPAAAAIAPATFTRHVSDPE